MEFQIQSAVKVMRSHPQSSAREILGMLLDSGIKQSTAAELVMVLPIVYGRALLTDCGVKFSEHYICMSGGLSGRELKLSDLSTWKTAVGFAYQEISSGLYGDAISVIAARSPEIDAINKALHNGRKLENLVIGPPAFLWG